MQIPDFDDKDLGILALLIIAIVWTIFGDITQNVVHDVVIALAGIITGVKLNGGSKE
jgi:hypothetical protein